MSKLGKISLFLSGLSLVCFAIFRFLLGVWVPFLWVCLGLFAIFLVLCIWADRNFFVEFLSMKTTKQGLSMGALISLVMVFLIAINFIAVRKYKTFDFSAAQVNTLSDQSKKLLAQLSEDLKIIYFYQKGEAQVETNRREFIELAKKYQDQSVHVKLEFVDVNERPDLTEKYGVTKGSGVVFLDYKGKKNQIQKIDEQELTSALVKVMREKDKTIYFTLGHGERDLEDGKEAGGAQLLKQMLENNRYTVKTINLNEKSDVPKDADVLMVLGPLHGFQDNEVKALENYLKAGGSLILALEPNVKHNLNKFINSFGLELKDDYLVNFMDTKIGRAVNPKATMGTEFSNQHPITQSLGKSQATLFRLPQTVQALSPVPEGLKIEPLVKSSEQTMSFSDTSFKGEGKIGVFPMGQAVSGFYPGTKETEMNLIVFGDSDFINNQLLYQNLNRDLILNSVAFLVKEDNLISIRPKEVGVTQMEITPTQFTVFLFGFIIALPIFLLGTSLTLWFRRRYA